MMGQNLIYFYGFFVENPSYICRILYAFYAPEGTSGGILKSHRPSVCPSVRLSVHPSVSSSVRYKSCLSDSSLTTKTNLMKLHRKIKDNEKLCRANDLDSYAQGQGHNQVRGQNCVSAITQKLLKQKRNFTER